MWASFLAKSFSVECTCTSAHFVHVVNITCFLADFVLICRFLGVNCVPREFCDVSKTHNTSFRLNYLEIQSQLSLFIRSNRLKFILFLLLEKLERNTLVRDGCAIIIMELIDVRNRYSFCIKMRKSSIDIINFV